MVEDIARKIGIPVELLEFNRFKQGTMYIGEPGGSADFINVTVDILKPDPRP